MATQRKSEVTKLLTVTLDKIHESKRAKCGPNLRKSLLVASVLHKARDVYVTEIKNIRADQSSPSVATDNSNDSDTTTSTSPESVASTTTIAVKRRFASQHSIVDEDVESQSSCETDMDSPIEDDDQPTHIKKRHFIEGAFTNSDSLLANDFLDELAAESENETESLHTQTDKENSPPSLQSRSSHLQSTVTVEHKLIPSPCGRCLKRRSSTTQYDYDSDTEVASKSSLDSFSNQYTLYVPRKRSRITSTDNSEPETASPPTLTFKTAVMDTTQINSLVKIFSQSIDVSEGTNAIPTCNVYENSTEFNTFALCRDSITLTA